MLRRAAAQLATRSLSAADGFIYSRAAAGAWASTSSSYTSSASSMMTAAAEWQTSIIPSSQQFNRGFSASSSARADAAQAENEEGMASPKSQRVERVVEQILELNLIEVSTVWSSWWRRNRSTNSSRPLFPTQRSVVSPLCLSLSARQNNNKKIH